MVEDNNSVSTGGGANIDHNVNTCGGDFSGRDRISGETNSIFNIQGPVYISPNDLPVKSQLDGKVEFGKQVETLSKGSKSSSETISPVVIVTILLAAGLILLVSTAQNGHKTIPNSDVPTQPIKSNNKAQTVSVNPSETKQIFFDTEIISISVPKRHSFFNSDYYGFTIDVILATQKQNTFITLKPGDCSLIDRFAVNLVELEPQAPHTGTFLITKLAPEAKLESCFIKPTATSFSHSNRRLSTTTWRITHEHYWIKLPDSDMHIYVDLAAEPVIGAEKDDQKITVEIKSFLGIPG